MIRAAMVFLLAALWPCSAAIQVTASHLVRTPPPGILLPRTPVEDESEFLTTDPTAFFLLIYSGGAENDKIRLEWRNPTGVLVQQNEHTHLPGVPQTRMVWKLVIAGGPAAAAPGNWQVRLFSNGQGIATTDFHIVAPPDTALNIVTRTLLPDATVSAPYFLQFNARGGKPPYRYTAAKSFPAGLTLSSEGTVSGTPLRRGSYRATVEVKDAAGNSVVRTMGIGVGAMAASNVRAGAHNLLKSGGSGACSATGSVTDFSASDEAVVLATTLEAPRGREGRIEWLNPRGEVLQVGRVTKAAERQECVVRSLPLAGHRAAQLPGEWRVRLFWADLEVFTLKFTVSPSKTVAATASGPARTGRIAILIGNQSYQKLPAVPAAGAGLEGVANALQQDGFEVVRAGDADLDNLRSIEHTLEGKLQTGDTALVYYAGYDARSGGDDWLLPVTFDPSDTGPMQSRAYSALRLLQWLEDSKAGLKFIFLDGAPAAGQPGENPGAVMGEVDESTALVYSRSAAPGAFARALAQVLIKPEMDARTALGIELAKAVPSPSPVAILGGGADFVFHK